MASLGSVLAVLAFPVLATAAAAEGWPYASDPRNGSSTDKVPAVEPRVAVLADNLEHPWSIAFLPDGSLLFTERPGRLDRLGADGKLAPPLAGVPAVHTGSQAGLFDLALDPNFVANRFIYLSYVEPRANGASGTAIARARLADDDGALENLHVIFRAEPALVGDNNYGCRLAFAPDGTLFATIGDRYDYRHNRLQRLDNDLGKVIRINTDGSIPPDNPFALREGALPEIWAYGLRNAEGAAINPASHQLWTSENGPMGGDEINIPEAGKNYGWPVVTYGKDYDGTPIGIGTAAPGMEQPVRFWTPSIAPSGIAFYDGGLFPAWKGSLFVAALKGQMLVRLSLDGERVTGEEHLLRKEVGQRIRDVRQGPDGALYLLTDDEVKHGRLLRLTPGI
ncbi:MAG TPA: PQQ-dependent sugar dehydrogenase [Hyphomicrobiales bacterium]|nr:PQQ-dependent sugar dehydrogenase [Hyphomicrobiales bacterium]